MEHGQICWKTLYTNEKTLWGMQAKRELITISPFLLPVCRPPVAAWPVDYPASRRASQCKDCLVSPSLMRSTPGNLDSNFTICTLYVERKEEEDD